MKIAVFGTGYVGLVTGACLADHGHDVICVDVDEKKLSMLNEGKVPFFEPGITEIVTKNKANGRLLFSLDQEKAIKESQVIFNCVGTPSSHNGDANLSYIFSVAESVGKHMNEYKTIITKSTVPPGTNRKLKLLIKTEHPFDIVSNPEFLREGAAVYDFNHPDRIIVGCETEKAKEVMQEVYKGVLRVYSNVIYTNLETAEMIKYTNNAFLSTKISFINEMANICELTGANIKQVAKALGMDNRIAAKFLSAGIGYGGSCFPKDVRALAGLARQQGYEASLLREVDSVNTRQRYHFLHKIIRTFNNTLAGKTIGIWGLSFKPKTSDMREAPSIEIIKGLLEAGAKVQAFDPEAIEEAKHIFEDKIEFVNNAKEAAKGVDAIALLTEWDEFRNIDMQEILSEMKGKKLFDGRNIFNPQKMKELGFEFYGIGQ